MKCKVHKFIRGKLGDKIIYKCLHCPSYVFFPLIIGRESICHGCGKTFRIGLKVQAKPHCGCLTKIYKKKYKLNSQLPSTNSQGEKQGEDKGIGELDKDELLDLLMKKIG